MFVIACWDWQITFGSLLALTGCTNNCLWVHVGFTSCWLQTVCTDKYMFYKKLSFGLLKLVWSWILHLSLKFMQWVLCWLFYLCVNHKKSKACFSKGTRASHSYSFTLHLFSIISDDRRAIRKHYYSSWSHKAVYMKTVQGYLRPLTTSFNAIFALGGKAFSEINVFTVCHMYVSRFLCRVIIIWCDQTYSNWHQTSINPSAKCRPHISSISSTWNHVR